MVVIEQEKYIQINDPDAAWFRDFWPDVRATRAGFSVTFCFHDEGVPYAELSAIGAAAADSCRETRLSAADFAPVPCGGAVLVDSSAFADFAALHDALNPDMYWTSRRVAKEPRWAIFTMGGGYVMLAEWPNPPEVFALEGGERLALLCAACQRAFAGGKTEVLFMVDDDKPQALAAARALGFRETGVYKSFVAQL